MKKPSLKALGIFTMLAGWGLSALSSWVDDKNLKKTIEDEVKTQLLKKGD